SFARNVKCPNFSGALGLDVVNWLKTYNNYCSLFNFDDSFKLAHVQYFLTGPAHRWWEYNGDSCASFAAFKTAVLQIYGDDDHRRQQARLVLSSRAQKSGESCFDYSQVILKLCKAADPNMADADKIAYILKGIAKYCFNIL